MLLVSCVICPCVVVVVAHDTMRVLVVVTVVMECVVVGVCVLVAVV